MIYFDSSRSENKQVLFPVCSCGITPVFFKLHLCALQVFSFISSPVVCVEFGQVVRAAINTVHIQLEHSITGCSCLLEIFLAAKWNLFYCSQNPLCNVYLLLFSHSFMLPLFCLVLIPNPLEFVSSGSTYNWMQYGCHFHEYWDDF